MISDALPVGLLRCNCLIFGDEDSRDALVVDPGDNAEGILEAVAKHNLSVKMIVLTHAHVDHLGAAQRLKEATGAPLYLNEEDLVTLDGLDLQASWTGMKPPERPEIDEPLREGDVLQVGSISVHVLFTPGHTPGGISLWIPAEKQLIVGDTLFRDSIGRFDLPGGDGDQLLRSIREKLIPLPDDSLVLPGHGPTTTLGREKDFNPFLQGM